MEGALMGSRGDFWFDRTVSEDLMGMLEAGPPAALVELARKQTGKVPLYDLQLRRDTKGANPKSWATLYYGLTSILDLQERRGEFRLTAHKKYRDGTCFEDAWREWAPAATTDRIWPTVKRYLDEVIHVVPGRMTRLEGRVHAALSSRNSDAYRIINREVSPGFRDSATKQRMLQQWVAPLNDALGRAGNTEKWWPARVKVGGSPDFLSVDIGGRLSIIEAKHSDASAKEIAKVSVQAGVYASMFATLLRHEPSTLNSIDSMLAQRTRLALNAPGTLYLNDARRVVPVIAIGPDRPSAEVKRRMWEVAKATEPALTAVDGVDPIEVWYVSETGRILEIERAADLPRHPHG